MKSPDEFHYGIEEPPRKRQICTCDRCDSGIFPGERVVTIELPRKNGTLVHSVCQCAAEVKLIGHSGFRGHRRFRV